MKPLTREQREALLRVYKRDWGSYDKPTSYLAFRRTAYNSHMDCVMVGWCSMWLGIEPDGYTHS
jgi:hypothetical protein